MILPPTATIVSQFLLSPPFSPLTRPLSLSFSFLPRACWLLVLRQSCFSRVLCMCVCMLSGWKIKVFWKNREKKKKREKGRKRKRRRRRGRIERELRAHREEERRNKENPLGRQQGGKRQLAKKEKEEREKAGEEIPSIFPFLYERKSWSWGRWSKEQSLLFVWKENVCSKRRTIPFLPPLD